jgi:hypothetical protein
MTGTFSLTHRAETVEDIANMLITASVVQPQDKPLELPLMPIQARHLGRALQSALALEAAHQAQQKDVTALLDQAEAMLEAARVKLLWSLVWFAGAAVTAALSCVLLLVGVLG